MFMCKLSVLYKINYLLIQLKQVHNLYVFKNKTYRVYMKQKSLKIHCKTTLCFVTTMTIKKSLLATKI